MATSTNQPNTTLYVNNLNDKVNKDELRLQLFALFTTYGKIVDIVASKSQKMRGQAFLVFTDLAGATSALRACEGMVFYDKPMHIDYAKTKSYATLRKEDPAFVPPNSANANAQALQNGRSEKRQRDQDAEAGRTAKREKPDDDNDDDDEEMEIDDDDDAVQSPGKISTPAVPTTIPIATQQPSARLLCTNLPQEVTDDVLSVLFQQYKGFQATQVVWSPTPNPDGARVKLAQVSFESSELASVAKTALDGFSLKKGWTMSVAYI